MEKHNFFLYMNLIKVQDRKKISKNAQNLSPAARCLLNSETNDDFGYASVYHWYP